MKKYKRPFLEDETIEIEDIINESLTEKGTKDPDLLTDEGEEFVSEWEKEIY